MGRFKGTKIMASCLLSLAISNTSAALALPAKPQRQSTSEMISGNPSADDLERLNQLKTIETTIGKFLDFLSSRGGHSSITAATANQLTRPFLAQIKDPIVLIGLAMQIRNEMTIFTEMPPSDRILWQSLYRNAVSKIRIKLEGIDLYNLRGTEESYPEKLLQKKLTRRQILSRQLMVNQTLKDFLNHALELRKAAGDDNRFAEKILESVVSKNIADVHTLTDLSVSARALRQQSPDYINNLLFDFSLRCNDLIANQPRQEAIPALNYLYHANSGGAASTEFLDENMAHALGITMAEFDRRGSKGTLFKQ